MRTATAAVTATAAAVVALAASLALLAGCAPAPELPAPITPEEAGRQLEAQREAWWASMFPDEPMPEIEAIEYVDPLAPGSQVTDCLRAADLDGLTFTDNGWTYASGDPEQDRAVDLALFTCAQQYPYDVSDPGAIGMLSDAEIEWVADYNDTRLVPCLRLLGYSLPVHDLARYWSPYDEMQPQPTTAGEWSSIDFHCPPSPIGPLLRPQMVG